MTAPILQKACINGYNLIHVHSDWLVCTDRDRLASFATQEEARAYAYSLPGQVARPLPDHPRPGHTGTARK